MKREMIGKEIKDNLRMKQRDNIEETQKETSCRSLIGLSLRRELEGRRCASRCAGFAGMAGWVCEGCVHAAVLQAQLPVASDSDVALRSVR